MNISFLPTIILRNTCVLSLLFCGFIVSAQGPNAPEAGSFEPVDATDMVNLVTGDFSYVLPLLNVPSPEGGYPIALSYHAGIAMDQEASWVGLGWNVNPGAINRSVNGCPDDWSSASISSIAYNKGGESKRWYVGYSVGTSFGSKGRRYSYSEYRSLNGGESSNRFDFDFTASLGIPKSPLSVNVTIGTSGVSAGIGLRLPSNDGTIIGRAGVGVHHSFINGSSSYGVNVDVGTNYSLGVSFSSSNGLAVRSNTPINLSGYSNPKFDESSTREGVDVQIPIGGILNIEFGYEKRRMWLFDIQFNKVFGSLYRDDFKNAYKEALFKHKVLSDVTEAIYKYDYDNQLNESNLSMITKDNYTVSGQGVFGSLSPSFNKASNLTIKSKYTYDGKSVISFFDEKSDDDSITFNFDYSNSSYQKVNSGTYIFPKSNEDIGFSFESQSTESSVEINGVEHQVFNKDGSRLRDGRYIKTYTNEEVSKAANNEVIKPSSSKGFDRNKCPSDGIGAYKITVLDGKTYHYSLPVYQHEKFTRNSGLNNDFELIFFEQSTYSSYATHWLLTAITGPDYVDINNNGPDKEDYGYWVLFDYGKWSEGMAWTGPFKQDLNRKSNTEIITNKNNKTKSYSWGIRESYYLNKIKTRTHTALFVKDLSDETSPEIDFPNKKYSYNVKSNQSRTEIDGNYYITGFFDEGREANSTTLVKAGYEYECEFDVKRQNFLRLDKIIVLKNEDVPNSLNYEINKEPKESNLSYKKENIYYYTNYFSNWQEKNTIFDEERKIKGHLFDNIIHKDAIDIVTISKASKIIEFDFDYSLAGNKLTLNKVHFLSKGLHTVLPPYKFDYKLKNTPVNHDFIDNWGFSKSIPARWNLNEIETPVGAKINVAYESDDYHKELIGHVPEIYDTGLNFEFTKNNENGRLRIKITNENDIPYVLDFKKKFVVGTTNLDIWLGWKHDYWQWYCKYRKASIDIVHNDVDVVFVDTNQLILETDWSVTSSVNSGLGMILDKVIGFKNHPGKLEEKDRGEYADPPKCIGDPVPRLVFQYELKSNKVVRDQKGGGIRVKELTFTDGNNNRTFKSYYYNAKGTQKYQNNSFYTSSGVTSYAPSRFFREIRFQSELPGPAVVYGNVSVENKDASKNIVSKSNYTYNTFSNSIVLESDTDYSLSNLLEIKRVDNKIKDVVHENETKNFEYNKYSVFNNSISFGQLLEVENLNSLGHVLSNTVYKYKSNNDIILGLRQESSNTIKSVPETRSYLATTTTKAIYPSVLQSITTTAGSYSKTQYFDSYDFLTGQVLETSTYNSDGTKVKTKIVPAYNISAYSNNEDGFGMGAKADNPQNKNMLSQVAANYTFLYDDTGKEAQGYKGPWKVLSANIDTWSNEWTYKNDDGSENQPVNQVAEEKVWRKHQTYVWDGALDENGILQGFDVDTDDGFEWGVGVSQTNPKWKKTTETSLYNHFSKPLEVTDINGNRAATKMGDGDSKVIATANASYADFFYSGGEYVTKDIEGNKTNYFDGEVGIADGIRFNYYGAKHTGSVPVTLYPFKKTFVVKPSTTDIYQASVWAYYNPDAITFPTEYSHITLRVGCRDIYIKTSEVVRAGDWVLLRFQATITAGQEVCIVANGNSYATLDDFRLHPVAATMTSYVYNQWDELTHIIGPNGLATEYVYDDAGNLTEVKKEVVANEEKGLEGGFKTVSKYQKNYKK